MAKKKPPLTRKTPPDIQNTSTAISPSTSVRNRLQHTAAVLSGHRVLIESIVIAVIIVLGILIRLEDIRAWRTYAGSTFYENKPLHTTFDAYFYLSLAKDIVDGTYAPVDEKRGVPDSPPRPTPPPLLSAITAVIAKITPWHLSWIAAVLPAIFGPLIVLPLYLFGRALAGPVCGTVSSLMAVLYPFYVYRSNLGRFDTDCLNITFALGAAYLFLRFGTGTTLWRYAWAAAGFVLYGFFLWWWDQSPSAVTAITVLPFIVALALYYRPGRREALVFGSLLAAAVVCLLAIKGPGAVFLIFKKIFLEYLYISKDASGDFPNIGVTISEQTRPSFESVVSYTSVNVLSFLVSVAGIGLMVWMCPRQTLMLGSLIVLSILAFTYANRFLLFFIPVIALGAGFMVSWLWGLRQRFVALYLIVPLLCVGMTLPLISENLQSVQWPKEPASIVAGMDAAHKKTPPDAVIWAWWDHGYALTYFARRATVNDGSIHSGERTVYTAIPYATDSFRYAANFMHFYVVRGIPGIQKLCNAAGSRAAGMQLIHDVLSAGPEAASDIIKKAQLKPTQGNDSVSAWLAFFFPRERRPVYLFLDSLLPKITYWWYWFGTWDVEKREGAHPFFSWHSPVTLSGNRVFSPDGLSLDIETGELQLGNQSASVAGMTIRDREKLREKNYYTGGSYRLEMFEPGRCAALMEKAIAESIFTKLYLRHTPDQRYFKPVALNAPAYQLWEVVGDRLP